jgi:predicted regulator of Ras-like GTPase activity (Roadblock/LC7/MglB family)
MNRVREKPVTFSESQMEEVEACIDELVRNTGAREILLADIAGRLISARGRLGKRETTATGVAALSAGGYAATVEMARYFEIETEFRQITYEGEYHSIYSSNVGNALIITVVFDGSVMLGIVRAFTNQAARYLQDVVNRALAEMEADDQLSEAEKLGAEFGQALMDEVEAFLVEEGSW